MINTQLFDLVEHTNRNVFLTGRAGTGKTTFLNQFVEKTRKKYIIVAPTGIAAINAGGVTIHSMFGLPLRTFAPTNERIDSNIAMNIQDLGQHFRFRKDKIKLLREVEIIIIDEVSMLRADVLDMIDLTLRHIRRNPIPFGGVQMLFIGDLFQLPPVVRDENEFILKKYYPSPFFFDAKALADSKLLTVELTEVYRQKDGVFLDILNEIRAGKLSNESSKILNQRVLLDFEPEEKYVSLCSHNRQAELINSSKLKELSGTSFYYKASIFGDFRENLFPNDDVLELKVGAQVMFIRNDASHEKKYFNGKLAEVVGLDAEDIWVKIDGIEDDYKLKNEIWEQKKYSLDADKNIHEEVLGSYEQFPIRLAWAVTIHKSQGLTFDKLMIDAGNSFASGQVYVALSRCRTLDGIILKTPINKEVIFTDERVTQFQSQSIARDMIFEIVRNEKYHYHIAKILNKLEIGWLKNELMLWKLSGTSSKILDQNELTPLCFGMETSVNQLVDIFKKFEKVIRAKVQKLVEDPKHLPELESKIQGAVRFFFDKIQLEVYTPLKLFLTEHKGTKGLKQFTEGTKQLLDELYEYLDELTSLYFLETKLLEESTFKDTVGSTIKTPTHVISYQLFESGFSVSEIAKKRGILDQTVFGHLSKFVQSNLIKIELLVAKEHLEAFSVFFKAEYPQNAQLFDSLNELKKQFPKLEYHELRLMRDYFCKPETS